MGLLLDTHYVYALAGAPGRLSAGERAFLAAPHGALFVSAVSIWEIRLKWQRLHGSGARKGPVSPQQAFAILRQLPLGFLPLTAEDAVEVLREAVDQNDPFDEILLAQAQRLGHFLVTRDAKLVGHPVVRVVGGG